MVLAGHFEIENERELSLTQRVECGVDDESASSDKVRELLKGWVISWSASSVRFHGLHLGD